MPITILYMKFLLRRRLLLLQPPIDANFPHMIYMQKMHLRSFSIKSYEP